MRISRYILLILIAVTILFSTVQTLNASPVYEVYYLTKIKDAQIGYSSESQETKQIDNKAIVITNRHYELKFKRLSFTIKIVQDTQYIEDEDGNPVSFSANIYSKGENVKVKGNFLSDKRLLVTTEVNGSTKTEEIELKKKILFPSAVSKLFQKQEDEIEFSTIDPTNDVRVVTVKAKKIGLEALNEETFQGEYMKYKVSVDFLPTISNYEWYDSDGRAVKEKSSLLGLERVITKKDKIVGNVESYDIFYKSLIPVSTHIVDPFNLENVSYKIETQSENPEELFIIDNRQSIVQTRDNAIYLKVKSQEYNDSFKYPVEAGDFAEYLRSGPFISSNDPDIVDQAGKLVSNKSDAYRIAKDMEKWVFDNINVKDLSVNFASASEVMKSREGDCTEHSVLLASILRAAGIPSKVVVGLIYTSMPEDSFVYHMWVNAYVGEWISLDPSFPSDVFSPVHIAISENSLNTLSSKTDIVLDVIKSFTTLKINILDYSSLSKNIIGIKISETENPMETKISLKSNNQNAEPEIKQEKVSSVLPITSISLKTGEEVPSLGTELKKKYIDDYTRSGFYNFSKGKITLAINDFEKISRLIPYNDDASDIKLALKLASLGLFNLAQNQMKNIHDNLIWDKQIKSIKNVYFPEEMLTSENEILLAEALSSINFQNNPEAAVSLIKKETALENSDYAHYLSAKAYAAMNKTDNALAEFVKAIEINPSNLSYRLELAKFYTKKNEFKKARRELDIILKQNIVDKKFLDLVNIELYWLLFKDSRKDNAKSQYYLAKYYYTKGEYKASGDILKKLIDNKQEISAIYELLGDIYVNTGQIAEAETSYENALKLNRKSSKAILGLGNILKNKKKYKEALEEYLKAEGVNPNNRELVLAIAGVYEALSQEEIAYQYYHKLLELDNDNSMANYKIGDMYLSSGDINKAEEYFKKALSVNPDFPKSWLGLTKIALERKNHFLAKTYLDSVSYLGQDNFPEYYYYMGLIEKNNENHTSARYNFKKALELKTDYKEAFEELEKISQ